MPKEPKPMKIDPYRDIYRKTRKEMPPPEVTHGSKKYTKSDRGRLKKELQDLRREDDE